MPKKPALRPKQPLFQSRWEHVIDSKGRLSIPVELRTEFQRHSSLPPVLTAFVQCLILLPHEHWQAIVGPLSQVHFQTDVLNLRRYLVSGAVEAPFDGQGRILVPPHLRRQARLEREVTVAGVGPWVELWDRGRFEQVIEETERSFPALITSAIKLGMEEGLTMGGPGGETASG